MTTKMIFISLSLFVLASCATIINDKANCRGLDSHAPFAKIKLETEPLAPLNPVMADKGIVIGGKEISVTPSGKIKILAEGKELASLYFNINTSAKKWMTQHGKAFFNKKLKYDAKKKTITFTADFPLDKQGAVGAYSHSIKLLSTGLISFEMKYAIPKGFDTNDYDYDFFPDPKRDRANAYRRYAPEQQITGGTNPLLPNIFEPNIKTAFKLTKTGYVYEIAFPAKYIVPLRLERGSISGFCVYLNDRDDPEIKKRGVMKSALTLTPNGTGAHMNPHLYPVMLLSGKKSK